MAPCLLVEGSNAYEERTTSSPLRASQAGATQVAPHLPSGSVFQTIHAILRNWGKLRTLESRPSTPPPCDSRRRQAWSVRIGLRHRSLAMEVASRDSRSSGSAGTKPATNFSSRETAFGFLVQRSGNSAACGYSPKPAPGWGQCLGPRGSGGGPRHR